MGRYMENFWLRLARMLPRRLRYWITILSVCEATQGAYSHQIVPDLLAMDVLKRIKK
jgi:hypothetical protein